MLRHRPKTAAPAVGIRRREITPVDLVEIADLLTKGFVPHRPKHWVRALKHLSGHRAPTGLPRYGYLLEYKGVAVGVCLHIFSVIPEEGEMRIRCNLSSWYVDPPFRAYAGMLVWENQRQQVTYSNVTPARHTLSVLEAQGFVRYCRGWFAALPLLSAERCEAEVEAISPEICSNGDLTPFERELLVRHANYGCISIICKAGNRTYPFVFMPRRRFGLVPFAYLIYCREMSDFVRLARPLGWFLAKAGLPLVLLEADGPICGLVGKFFNDRPKYYKGPHRPRLGNLAYSELAMFPFRTERPWANGPKVSLT